MKNIAKAIPAFLALCVIFLADYFFAPGSLLTVIKALLIGTVVFYAGAVQYQLNRIMLAILFSISTLFLLETIKDALYLCSILLLSYLLWNFLTPALVKYKRALTAATALAVLSVFLCCIAKVDIPLLPIVFYPLYLYGYLSRTHVTDHMHKEGVLIALRLLFAVILFSLLYANVGDAPYISGLLFLKVPVTGITSAMQFPFVVLAFLFLAFQIGAFLLFVFRRIYRVEDTDEIRQNRVIETAKTDFMSILFLFLLSAIIYISVEWMLRGETPPVLELLFTSRAIFNVLLYASICFVLLSLTGRVWSTILTVITSLLLILANFVKLTYFDEPFYPWDISIIKNALMICGHYITPATVVLSFFFIACLTYCIRLYHDKIKRGLRVKPTLALLPFAVTLFLSNCYILYQADYLKELKIEQSWYIGKQEMIANGYFAQSALYLKDVKKYIPSAPKGYSKNQLQKILNDLSAVKSANQSGESAPDIVIVMDESFWDPTRLGVTFNKNITETLQSYQSGNIVSPVFGAKTANTEFEVLTGMSMYFMEPSMIPYNLYFRRSTPSVVSALRNSGYETIAIHPNDASFYNRKTVYESIGFDRFIDIKDFVVDEDAGGYYITDNKVVNKILEVLNEKSNKPKLIFALTIENHDPYYSRYEKAQVQVETDVLDDTQKRVLNNYSQGVYSGDRALKKLIDALDGSETPTNLYFFGDHLPRLGSPNGIYDVYEALGYFENLNAIYKDEKLFTVPLVTWSNYKELSKLDKPISPMQLGYEVLRDAAVSYPQYFDILGALKDKYPVLQSIIDEKAALSDGLVQKYQMIQYDLLFGKQYLLTLAGK